MTPIAVVSGCIRQDGLFYVGRRTGAYAGCWEFLGGKVDPGETPEAALVRELMEEARVLVSVGNKIVSTPVLANADKGFIVTLYEVKMLLGAPQITEDHSEVAWLTLEDLLKLKPTEMTPSMPYFLEALQQSPPEGMSNPLTDGLEVVTLTRAELAFVRSIVQDWKEDQIALFESEGATDPERSDALFQLRVSEMLRENRVNTVRGRIDLPTKLGLE